MPNGGLMHMAATSLTMLTSVSPPHDQTAHFPVFFSPPCHQPSGPRQHHTQLPSSATSRGTGCWQERAQTFTPAAFPARPKSSPQQTPTPLAPAFSQYRHNGNTERFGFTTAHNWLVSLAHIVNGCLLCRSVVFGSSVFHICLQHVVLPLSSVSFGLSWRSPSRTARGLDHRRLGCSSTDASQRSDRGFGGMRWEAAFSLRLSMPVEMGGARVPARTDVLALPCGAIPAAEDEGCAGLWGLRVCVDIQVGNEITAVDNRGLRVWRPGPLERFSTRSALALDFGFEEDTLAGVVWPDGLDLSQANWRSSFCPARRSAGGRRSLRRQYRASQSCYQLRKWSRSSSGAPSVCPSTTAAYAGVPRPARSLTRWPMLYAPARRCRQRMSKSRSSRLEQLALRKGWDACWMLRTETLQPRLGPSIRGFAHAL